MTVTSLVVFLNAPLLRALQGGKNWLQEGVQEGENKLICRYRLEEVPATRRVHIRCGPYENQLAASFAEWGAAFKRVRRRLSAKAES